MKITSFKLLAFACSLAFFVAIGCSNDDGTDPVEEEPVEEEDPTNNDDDCITTDMTYNGEIKTLINTSCATASCHAGNNNLPSLATYQDVVALKGRVEARALDAQTMPPAGPLADCDMKKLQAWLNDGAPEE